MKKVVLAIISRNVNNETEYLLIKSKRDFGKYTGLYYPPGGHVKYNENEREAIIREVKEEVGLDIEPVKKITETPNDIEGEIACWWGCKVKSGDITVKTDEIGDADYFVQEDIKKMGLWPATRKFFEMFVF